MTSLPSSITDLNNAIKSHNPFDRPLVVRSHDVWEKSFPDVPSLNAHASDAVFESIEKVFTGQRPVVGITITAERGLGKSHLISRIRHRLQTEGGALFVYMSEYNDLNRLKFEFLQTLASSLKKIGNKDVMQWRELAAALVNEVYNKSYTPQQLFSRFPGALAQKPKLVDLLTAKILTVKPDIDNPYLIKAILWTLSPDYTTFAINWLSGKELAQSQADAMGLPNPTKEDKEAESFKTVCQLLDLIGDYSKLVICFDELDGTGCDQQGFTRSQVAASLAKDLYNKIKRGVLLITMSPENWTHHVRAMPQAEAVTDRIGEKIFELRYLNSDDVVSLVSQWLKEFYDEKGLTPHYPVYPFEEGELRELGKEKPIVRRVLKWCADSYNVRNGVGSSGDDVNDRHPVKPAFNKELADLEGSVKDYLENKNTIADALRLCFLTLIGQTVERVKIEDITEVVSKSVDRGYIDFKIIGKENGKVVKIGVAVVQLSGGMGVQAALKRLIDYKKFDLTRGCLVRSKAISRNATQAQNLLNELLSPTLGGEWVPLKAEDIKPLLALLFVYQAREDYELSEEQIFDFTTQNKLAVENYLIGEILSDPSHQIPDGLVDEDNVAEKTTTSETINIENTDRLLDNLLHKLNL